MFFTERSTAASNQGESKHTVSNLVSCDVLSIFLVSKCQHAQMATRVNIPIGWEMPVRKKTSRTKTQLSVFVGGVVVVVTTAATTQGNG